MAITVTQPTPGEPPLHIEVSGLPRPVHGTVTAIVQRSTDGGVRWTTARGLPEAELTPTTLMHDTFSRTVSGGWGTPDEGPDWVPIDTIGGTLSVADGYGIMTMTATEEDRVVRIGSSLSLVDVQLHLRSVSPESTPVGDQIHSRIDLRGANAVVLLSWNPDGTAEIQADGVGDGLPSGGPVPVPGVTASDPVDLLVLLVGGRLWVWAAPTSEGITLGDGPLLAIRVGSVAAGPVDIVTETDASLSVPLAMRYGEVTLIDPGTGHVAGTVDDWEFRPGVENRYRAGLNQVLDTFGRTVSGGWGTGDTGQSWTTTAGAAANVTPAGATFTHADPTSYRALLDDPTDIGDIDHSVTVLVSAADITGNLVEFGLTARWGSGVAYRVVVAIDDDESMSIRIVSVFGGAEDVESAALPITHAGQVYRVRMRVDGHRVRGKCWDVLATPEPDWQVDATIPSGRQVASGQFGIESRRAPGNSNANLVFAFDDYVADIGQPQWIGGTASITPTLDRPWLCSVMRSFLNRPITIRSYQEPSRAARGGLTPIAHRTLPIAQVELAGGREWPLEVRAADLAEARAIEWIAASGDVLWLLVPAGSPIPGGYYRVGQLDARHHRQQGPTRWLTLPLTEVAAPGPDIVTAQSTVDTVLALYGTVEELLAQVPTVEALLELIGDPAEVIVDQ